MAEEEFRSLKISDPDGENGGTSAFTQTLPISLGITVPKNRDTAKALVQQSIYLDQLAPDYLLLIYQYLSPLDVANASMASDYLSNFAEAHHINTIFADCRIAVVQYEPSQLKLAWHEGGHSSISRSEKIYLWDEFKTILRHFGPYIKRIRFDGHNECQLQQVALIVQHCPHLDVFHLEHFDFCVYNKKALEVDQCSAKQAILDNVKFNPDVYAKLLPNLTAVSIYRFNNDEIRHVFHGLSTLERLTLANGTINFDLFQYLQKHRDTLYSLALININFQGSRYTGIADMFPKLEQLQISVASKEDLDALAGMNIKYLQLVAEKQLPDKTMSTGWSLHGLPLLEELDLVEMEDRVVLDVPSVRVLSTDYSSRVQDHIAKLPNLQRLRMRKFHIDPKELDSLFEKYCKKTEVELEYPLPQEMPKIMEYLHLRFVLKMESPLLVRIIGSQSEIKRFDTGSQPPNVQMVSEDYCKQMQKFDPLPERLRKEANDFDFHDEFYHDFDINDEDGYNYHDYFQDLDDVFDEGYSFDDVESEHDILDDINDLDHEDVEIEQDILDDINDLDHEDVEIEQDILDDINAAIYDIMDNGADDILAAVNIDDTYHNDLDHDYLDDAYHNDLNDDYHNDLDHDYLDDAYQNDLDDAYHIDYEPQFE